MTSINTKLKILKRLDEIKRKEIDIEYKKEKEDFKKKKKKD